MTIGTRLMTWFRGELVGSDPFGNRYYRDKSRKVLTRGGGRFSREKRWVIYKGAAEASKVPPQWHAWLHHTVDELPKDFGQPALCVGEAASRQPHGHARRLSPARLGRAWRPSPEGRRGLRAVATGVSGQGARRPR